MKKVLSLLLACAMIFSLASVVSADGEGYTIKAGTIQNVKSGKNYIAQYAGDVTEYTVTSAYDADFENVLFTSENVALEIVTNTNASSGYIAIDYDETKVTPVTLGADSSEVYRDTDSTYGWAIAEGNATVTESTEATAIANGNLVVTWTGSMTAGDTIAYITFLCNEGVTTEDFNSETFVISEDEDFATTYKLRNGGASLDYQGTTYKASEGTLSTALTYPNYDVSAGGDDPVESCVVADGVATVTAVYTEDVAGTAIIAVYNADGRMIAHKVGDAVSGKNFTINTDAFEGTAATVKVFVWDEVATKNTAKVAAKVFDDEIVFN